MELQQDQMKISWALAYFKDTFSLTD